MNKRHINLTIDGELYQEAKKHGLNISFICAAALRQEINRKLGIDPRLKEIEALRLRLTQLEVEDKALIPAPNPAPSMTEAAPKPSRSLEDLIKQEVGYWPSIVKRGLVSTQTKRDRFYQERSKLLGISTLDYINLVVDPALKIAKGK